MSSTNLAGRANGFLTEKIAFAIMELFRKEKIDIGVDLHESAPEYPVINAIVFHETSSELAALALLDLRAQGYDIRLEASPVNLRGLSHREWGDHAGIMAVLLETPNASHGRLKGKPSPSLVVDGREGQVLVNPDAETRSAYRKLEREFFLLKDELATNRDLAASMSKRCDTNKKDAPYYLK